MVLIDSHCHLASRELWPRSRELIQRARAVGVAELVCIATDADDAQRALQLSAADDRVHAVCGLHPHETAKAPPGWDSTLLELARRPDVRAIGEMGLDYHYDFADRPAQLRAFRRQLEISAEVAKPVVIHCREAHSDVLKTLADFPLSAGVVFHCFTGTLAEADQIIEMGFWISLTGVVTFKRSDELRQVARRIPQDRLMIETDSPYLSPEPVRSVRPNEPAHLVHTAACIARERELDLAEFASLTVTNTRRFFRLPERPGA